MPQYRMTVNELQVLYSSPDVVALEAHLEQLKVLYGYAREASALPSEDYDRFLRACIQEKQRLIRQVLGLTARGEHAQRNGGSTVHVDFDEMFRK